MKYYVTVNGRSHAVELDERMGAVQVSVDGKPLDLTYEEVDDLGQVVVQSGGRSYGLSIEGRAGEPGDASVTLAGHHYDVKLEDERERAAHAAERDASKGGGVVTSIMPGIVVEILVARGAQVAKGDPLLILTAMKMQNEIAAPAAGVVQDIHVATGQAVSAGAKLVTLSAPAG